VVLLQSGKHHPGTFRWALLCHYAVDAREVSQARRLSNPQNTLEALSFLSDNSLRRALNNTEVMPDESDLQRLYVEHPRRCSPVLLNFTRDRTNTPAICSRIFQPASRGNRASCGGRRAKNEPPIPDSASRTPRLIYPRGARPNMTINSPTKRLHSSPPRQSHEAIRQSLSPRLVANCPPEHAPWCISKLGKPHLRAHRPTAPRHFPPTPRPAVSLWDRQLRERLRPPIRKK